MKGKSCCSAASRGSGNRSEEHTSELQSLTNLVCRLLLLFLRAQGQRQNTFRVRQREQGSQQRQGIGVREAIRDERLLEFTELDLGGLMRGELQQPL